MATGIAHPTQKNVKCPKLTLNLRALQMILIAECSQEKEPDFLNPVSIQAYKPRKL